MCVFLPQLKDTWNREFQKVLGPLSAEGTAGLERSFVHGDMDMLAVNAECLPKREGEQSVFTSLAVQIHPLRVQITEDMINALYAFAFPGKHVLRDGRMLWENNDIANSLTIRDPAAGPMTVSQNRQSPPPPSLILPLSVSLLYTHSLPP